jgi:hydrogenase nickel incorporation protein HypA/HybF
MHEFPIARRIVELVGQQLLPGQAGEVRSVKLKVGELTGLAPEALTFCFEAACEGTAVQGAILEIEQVPGDELIVAEFELMKSGEA